MKKSRIKCDIDRLYCRLSERFDMRQNEMVELSFKTCSDIDGRIFISVECVVVNKATGESNLVTMDLGNGKDRHSRPGWMERLEPQPAA